MHQDYGAFEHRARGHRNPPRCQDERTVQGCEGVVDRRASYRFASPRAVRARASRYRRHREPGRKPKDLSWAGASAGHNASSPNEPHELLHGARQLVEAEASCRGLPDGLVAVQLKFVYTAVAPDLLRLARQLHRREALPIAE